MYNFAEFSFVDDEKMTMSSENKRSSELLLLGISIIKILNENEVFMLLEYLSMILSFNYLLLMEAFKI